MRPIPSSCWLHACLHKIEGDAGNARYWYARSGRSLDDLYDPSAELRAIAEALDSAEIALLFNMLEPCSAGN